MPNNIKEASASTECDALVVYFPIGTTWDMIIANCDFCFKKSPGYAELKRFCGIYHYTGRKLVLFLNKPCSMEP